MKTGTMNPNAIFFAVFCGSLGYLINQTDGLAWGLCISSGLSVLLGVISR